MKMEINIKENYLIIKSKVKEFIFIPMKICMMGNGLMTKDMVRELIHGKMGKNLKDNGLIINKKAKEF